MRWFGALLCLLAVTVGAQSVVPEAPTTTTNPAPADTGPPPGPADPYLRGVPRTAARGYLLACREGDYQRAAAYLDLRHVPRDDRETRGPILAQHLKVVLDRTIWVDVDTMSNEPEGDLEDGLAARREILASIQTKAGPVDLLMERVPREDGVLIWKIASSAIDRVPDLYEEFGYGPLSDLLPDPFFRVRFFEVQLWQWCGFIVVALLAALGAWLGTGMVLSLIRPIAKRSRGIADDRLLAALRPPLRFGVGLMLFSAGIQYLKLAIPAERFVGALVQAGGIVLWTWIFLRAADVLMRASEDRFHVRGQSAALAIVPLGRRTARIFIIALGMIAALQHIGFNVTGLLAGLGVGGLAIALAAQKTVENLIGGIILVTDQPVRVGDTCRFGSQTGTVEDIGLRSTRVRTADRTVVIVPNAVFSSIEIENLSRRDRIRLSSTFTLRHDTSREQVQQILENTRQALLQQDSVEARSVQVRLIRVAAAGPEIEVTAFVRTTDMDEFVAIRERTFLQLMDTVTNAGTAFAAARTPA